MEKKFSGLLTDGAPMETTSVDEKTSQLLSCINTSEHPMNEKETYDSLLIYYNTME